MDIAGIYLFFPHGMCYRQAALHILETMLDIMIHGMKNNSKRYEVILLFIFFI